MHFSDPSSTAPVISADEETLPFKFFPYMLLFLKCYFWYAYFKPLSYDLYRFLLESGQIELGLIVFFRYAKRDSYMAFTYYIFLWPENSNYLKCISVRKLYLLEFKFGWHVKDHCFENCVDFCKFRTFLFSFFFFFPKLQKFFKHYGL